MSEIVLPPFTPKEIASRDYQEALLDKGLRECWHGSNFDAERAEKFARAYVIEIFNTICNLYRAKIDYRAEWLPEIVHEAVFRALMVYKGHREQDIGQITDSARDAVMHHLRTTSTSERARSEFNQAFGLQSLDPQPSDTPLVQLAKEQARNKLRAARNPPPTTPKSESNFGEALDQLLREKNIRPEELADKMGIEWSTIYRHISGRHSPNRGTLKKYTESLSGILGYPVNLPTPAKRQKAKKTLVKRQ